MHNGARGIRASASVVDRAPERLESERGSAAQHRATTRAHDRSIRTGSHVRMKLPPHSPDPDSDRAARTPGPRGARASPAGAGPAR